MTDLENGAGQPAAEPTPVANEAPVDSIDAALSGMDAIYDKINPPRAEDGTYKSPAGGDEPDGAEPSDTGTQEIQTGQSPTEAVREQPTAAIAPPQSWSADMKPKWESLPPDIREYVAKRESEAQKRISELGQAESATRPIRELYEHFRPVYESKGLSADQATALLFQAQAKLDRDPVNAIAEIAHAYGIDLQQVYGGQPQQGQQSQPQGEQVDYIRALEQKIANLERGLGHTYQTVQAREAAAQQQHTASLAKLVEEFSKDKADFADVEEEVAAEIEVLKRRNPDLEPRQMLEQAYERALWSNPERRTRLIAQQSQKQQEAEEQRRRAEAEKAKKAGSVNVRSQPNSAPVKKASVWETMDAVAERIASRQ